MSSVGSRPAVHGAGWNRRLPSVVGELAGTGAHADHPAWRAEADSVSNPASEERTAERALDRDAVHHHVRLLDRNDDEFVLPFLIAYAHIRSDTHHGFARVQIAQRSYTSNQ
jgi:hypothetical protein